MRIVSMLPSATEIVYALDLGDELVGVTFECDEPPGARAEKTVIVSGRDTSGMTPGEIDGYVREQLAAGRDLYTLDAGALAGLRPELILTQDLCRVCALPSGHVDAALDYLGCQADVLSLDPYSLDDVLDTILAVGQRAGAAGRASRLVATLRDRLDRIRDAVAGLPAQAEGGGGRVGGSAVHRRALDSRHGAGGWRRAGRVHAEDAVAPDDVGRYRRSRTGRLIDGVTAMAAILHPGAVPAPPGAVPAPPPGQVQLV
ncbi:MAG TPA: ABC transporter substrate-binding protein [Streptosporangiaceae bacterium]